MKKTINVLIGLFATALALALIKLNGTNDRAGVPVPPPYQGDHTSVESTTRHESRGKYSGYYGAKVIPSNKTVIFEQDKGWLEQHDLQYQRNHGYSIGYEETGERTPHIYHHEIICKNALLKT